LFAAAWDSSIMVSLRALKREARYLPI
jgi:hypothetical protein